jgi:Cu-Zn family superoxide dismutase
MPVFQRIKKTRKNRKNRKVKKTCVDKDCTGIAVLATNNHGVEGIIKFKEERNGVKIHYRITGLSDGKHGFHIHQYGDLTDGCTSACSHFNPFNKSHGGLHGEERHLGDLGNITSKNNIASGNLFAKEVSLESCGKTSIIGRMIIVHEDPDDLGKGGDIESTKTGNAGKRLACGVIGRCR